MQAGDYSSMLNYTGDPTKALKLNDTQYNQLMDTADTINPKKIVLGYEGGVAGAGGGAGTPASFGGIHSIDAPGAGQPVSIGGVGYVVKSIPKEDTTKRLYGAGRSTIGSKREGAGWTSSVQYVEVQNAKTGEIKKLYVNGLLDSDKFWQDKNYQIIPK